MARKKRKPADPEAIAAAKREKARQALRAQHLADGVDPDIAQWGEEEVTRQRQQELEAKGVQLALDQRRRLKHAKHIDIWEQLAKRDGLTGAQYDAVRAFQETMAVRARAAGRGAAHGAPVVDSSGDACAVTDRMIEAGRRMDLTLALIGPPLSRLLSALMWPAVLCEHYDWREIVARVAGEHEPHAQGALLRIAAQALVDVAPDVERKLAPKRAHAPSTEAHP